jgi:hypothetical protein
MKASEVAPLPRTIPRMSRNIDSPPLRDGRRTSTSMASTAREGDFSTALSRSERRRRLELWSLRLPLAIQERVERARLREDPPLSRNAFIARALKRELARSRVPRGRPR